MDLSGLNPQQREAVAYTDGPLLVLAGAGSGKTRVLTHRIAYLIEEKGMSPYGILALTFTNKAAGEMRERVEKLLHAPASGMWVLTFHAMCARILRMEIEALGYSKTFVIYDDADQQSLLKRIIKELNLSDKVYTPRMLSAKISEAKNHSLHAEGYLRESLAQREIVAVYNAYQKQLKASDALDFDDLLLLSLQLFTEFPEVLHKYRSRFTHILIDEYQDTNLIQYNLVRLLAMEHRNLCVVGDDDQSIYGWRGADIRNILEFEKDFPGAHVIRLEQNYRSTGVILNAANLIIANNRGRKEKKLWTERDGGAPIDAFECADERDEANRICSAILQDARYGKRNYDEYALLYRTHAQSRILEMYLKSYDIPYRVYGGTSFFQRAEVKDILAYLRLLLNPNDDVAFLRIVNVPRRGIGDVAIEALQAEAAAQGLALLPTAMTLSPTAIPRHRAKFSAFVDTIQAVYAQIGSRPLAEITELLLDAIGYDAYLREDRKENYEARADVVREFVGYIQEFTSGMDERQVNVLQSFLENVALFSQADDIDEQNGRVSLMTLHSAKGLEFPVVFLPGVEEGLFPSAQSAYEPEKLEEERRLMYVGITRAREELHVSWTRQRMLYGKITPGMPSSFVRELAPALPDTAKAAGKSRFAEKLAAKAPQTPYDRHGLTAPVRTRKEPVPRYTVESGASIAAGFGAKQPSPPPSGKNADYAAGQRIRHKTFGEGTVLTLSGTGNAAIAEIAFDSGVNKKFAAAYAPIEKIPS